MSEPPIRPDPPMPPLPSIRRGCLQTRIHFVTPNGQIIPFATYNLFYRNGMIDGIRARMQVASQAGAIA